MSVGRKESNNLVEKAGKAIVDLALSLSSRHAISNAACSEGMRLRNVTYYNGKLYQLNLDGTRGDEIKMGGTPVLDYTNYLHVFVGSAPSDLPSGATYGLTFTATEECYLFGTMNTNYTNHVGVKINGHEYIRLNGSEALAADYKSMYIEPLKLRVGDTVVFTGGQNRMFIVKEAS